MRVIVAVGLQDLPEFAERDLVFSGDIIDGPVQGLVIHADPGPGRELKLNAAQNQAVQHLPLQHRAGRQSGPFLAQLSAHRAQPLLQLALHDHVFIDDRDDPIQRHIGRARRRPQQQRAQGRHKTPGENSAGPGGRAHLQVTHIHCDTLIFVV